LHAPPLPCLYADLLDDAERLVSRDDRVLGVVLVLGRGALVLLVVAAADAARLDAEQGVVGPDGRPRELPVLELLGLEGDGCAAFPCHGSSLLPRWCVSLLSRAWPRAILTYLAPGL